MRERKRDRRPTGTEKLPFGKITSPADLGRAIRHRRKEDALTQAQASALCNVGTRFLSELERGKATAELGKVMQVTSGLGLDLHVVPRGSLPRCSR